MGVNNSVVDNYIMDKLKQLLKNSYVPYSNFRVSALIETNDGNMFGGVNVENSSYMYGSCAETTALCKMVTAGYSKCDINRLYIMVNKPSESTPCFLCRQWISEFMLPDKEIVCMGNTGDYKIYKVSELCPHAFGGEDLNEARVS